MGQRWKKWLHFDWVVPYRYMPPSIYFEFFRSNKTTENMALSLHENLSFIIMDPLFYCTPVVNIHIFDKGIMIDHKKCGYLFKIDKYG